MKITVDYFLCHSTTEKKYESPCVDLAWNALYILNKEFVKSRLLKVPQWRKRSVKCVFFDGVLKFAKLVLSYKINNFVVKAPRVPGIDDRDRLKSWILDGFREAFFLYAIRKREVKAKARKSFSGNEARQKGNIYFTTVTVGRVQCTDAAKDLVKERRRRA